MDLGRRINRACPTTYRRITLDKRNPHTPDVSSDHRTVNPPGNSVTTCPHPRRDKNLANCITINGHHYDDSDPCPYRPATRKQTKHARLEPRRTRLPTTRPRERTPRGRTSRRTPSRRTPRWRISPWRTTTLGKHRTTKRSETNGTTPSNLQWRSNQIRRVPRSPKSILPPQSLSPCLPILPYQNRARPHTYPRTPSPGMDPPYGGLVG
jgi:hypothetical protein